MRSRQYIRKITPQRDGQLRIAIPKALCVMLGLTQHHYLTISITTHGELLMSRVEAPPEIVRVREEEPCDTTV